MSIRYWFKFKVHGLMIMGKTAGFMVTAFVLTAHLFYWLIVALQSQCQCGSMRRTTGDA